MQKDEVTTMLIVFKEKKISVSGIEKELGFSNGQIGKVAKGVADLSEDKFKKLQDYFAKLQTPQHTQKIDDSVEEVQEFEEPPLPKEEKKRMVVTPKGELKDIPSNEAEQRSKETMDKLNKRFGAGTVIKFGEKPNTDYKVVSTGSFGLDNALGIGGLPLGRIVELYGWESSGKTTIALNVIANAQKQGLKCLLVDAENAFDPDYAFALGVNVDELNYSQPSSGEEGLEVAENMIRDGIVQVVVIDSVAALVPSAELSGEMGESKMGLHARLMSQACRKMVNVIARQDALVIFINQLRHKIGVLFGNPETTTGGLALQFYASIRMEVRRSTTEKNSITVDGIKEGNSTTVKVIKNKCASPFRSASFDILYGKGIDRVGEVFEAGIKTQTIIKESGKYLFKDTELGTSKEEARQFLSDNDDFMNEVAKAINSKKE